MYKIAKKIATSVMNLLIPLYIMNYLLLLPSSFRVDFRNRCVDCNTVLLIRYSNCKFQENDY